MKQISIRQAVWLYWCAVAPIFFLVHARSVGNLSLHGFRISVVIWLVAILLIVPILLRRATRDAALARQAMTSLDPTERKRIKRSIWAMRFWLGMLLLSLMIGLKDLASHDLIPSMIGLAVNLSLDAALIYSLFRLQKRLNQG